ncbi:hypothetical protein PLANPX_4305 [Lacipirellula parvula]|uniref:Uncharacterized protein n=1 Tax=Lacipirellula parvula TaxID=2650471 RepID=A0A5K7XKA1_9BACT|nr:hypothetical protein PLANPX_4305 [Lacipirellula parvula]
MPVVSTNVEKISAFASSDGAKRGRPSDRGASAAARCRIHSRGNGRSPPA